VADNLRWFKVWTHLINDPHFQELSLNDMGRWTLLGAYVAQHGIKGRLRVPPQASRLCQILRCDRCDLKSVLNVLPNVLFEEGKTDNDDMTVTMQNWLKYQVDRTVAERVKRLRSKRREDKIREDEIRIEEKDLSSDLKQVQSSAPPVDPYILSCLEQTTNLKSLGNGKHGAFWKTLEIAYDSYDFIYFEEQIKKADAWIAANPSRKPTERGLPRFFRSWMERAVEKGRKTHG